MPSSSSPHPSGSHPYEPGSGAEGGRAGAAGAGTGTGAATGATTIVWLRDDLRVADNPALFEATQAGNQLLALQAQQLADLTAVVAANGRAQALTEAERAAAAEQGREQRRRFLAPGTGYQPGNAQMFNNGNN